MTGDVDTKLRGSAPPPPPPTLGIGLPEIGDGTDPVMPEKLSVRFKRFARRLLRRP